MRLARWLIMLIGAGEIGGGVYYANTKPADQPDGPAPIVEPVSAPVTDDPAILEAKEKETGETLLNGGSVEVVTDSGLVIVSKDENGNVTYEKK